MLTIDNHYLLDTIISDFKKNQKVIEFNKITVNASKKKMSFTLRVEFEFIFFSKNRKNITAAYKNLFSIKKNLRKLYIKFSQADIRGKEDIFLEVEKIKSGLGEIGTEKQLLFILDVLQDLNNKFIIEFSNFEQKLKKELYGDIEKRSYTKNELEAMAAKFKDFPKEILEDHSSDKYSKKYL